jgi:gluconolactonase
VNNSGIVAKVGVFVQLHGGLGGPDGIALDEDGCLIVAHTGFGSIWRLSPVAEPLLRITSCAGFSTTNIAFGGSDRKTLFITESHSGSILIAPMPAPGQRLFSHSDTTGAKA